MKFRNIWFDFTSILCFLLMSSCATFVIIDYFRGKGEDLFPSLLTAAIILLLALTYFRMSMQIGKYQEKARRGKRLDDIEAKGKDTHS
jgi:hypothetical protein